MKNRLSPVEYRILQLMAQGSTNAEIAREYNITHKSVKTRIGSIRDKLGVPKDASREDMLAVAAEKGLIES